MTTIPPTIVALRQGWQDFRSAWKAATGFLLFIAALDWALLSPLIVWGQWRVADNKLRLDLFDRRYKVYDALRLALSLM